MLNSNMKKAHKTVLVVDDSEEMVVLLETLLKKRGLEVLSASNPRDAYRLFRDHNEIALVIMDINLRAQENGVSLARKFRDLGGDRHFSLCLTSSSHVDESFVHAVQKIGVDDFLAKPIKMAQFQTAVDDLLGETTAKIDLSKRIECHLCCEMIRSSETAKMECIEITPNSFLLRSSVKMEPGETFDLRCTALQSILSTKNFHFKVLTVALGTYETHPYELRIQLVADYTLRLQLDSLFERSKLPQGLSWGVPDLRH